MEKQIQKEIEHQARKLLKRFQIDVWSKGKSQERYEKRSAKPATKTPIRIPDTWKLHPHFNPIYCIKHRRYLAKSIWAKLLEGKYAPQPALMHEIPKPSGGTRTVMVFSVPDAAVSGFFHKRLTKKNINIFSPHNFSYRDDRNVFDAIIDLSSAISGENTYVVQYDFKAYFDSISHEYLEQLLSENGPFLISKVERSLLRAFFKHEYALRQDYVVGKFAKRQEGVPQGSSLSLFLSNIAGHELDKALEKHGGQFVRFADDVVAVTYTYEDALGVSEVFSRHCERSGVEVNREKSPGISLLSGIGEREIRTIKYIDYLGHRFTKDDVMLSGRSIKRIKKRISHILYLHLIQTPRDRKLFNAERVGPGFGDWDLVTCLNEIRRYIYGGLRHSDLKSFIEDNKRLRRMRGLMSFYPLVSDCSQLRELDGWLVNVIYRACRERGRALASLGHAPLSVDKKQILNGKWHVSPNPKIYNETLCPSFVYAWRAARKYYLRYGLSDIEPPGYYSDENSY